MKVSFITTVYNEESSINALLRSLLLQSKLPDETIIVDGGSTDSTLSVIFNFQFSIFKKNVKIITKKGNRSVGRNEAIKNASNEIIVCADAGCILDRDWVKNIIEPFNDPKVDVVAGYYRGKPRTIFEKCLIPYVLVMEDKINNNNFLPASRSMAFKKSVWKKADMFPEEFSNNEDYVFAKRLKKMNANIVFEKKAIVYWMPRKNFKEAFVMFFRFALGDAQSFIVRPKIIFLFTRYVIAVYLLIFYFSTKSSFVFFLILALFTLYLSWAIIKNYSYVSNIKAIAILPLLQLIADVAVLLGSTLGFFRKIIQR